MSLSQSVSGLADVMAAVAYALAHDVVVVAGAGNTDKGQVSVGAPANIPGVVAVSGTSRDGGYWSGSAHGTEVALAAPAVDIVCTTPSSVHPSGYGVSNGTSPATAIVSGTVALIRVKYPGLNAINVIQRLIAMAKDQPPAGHDEFTGCGTVRVVDALTRSVPQVSANPLGTPSASPAAAAGAGGVAQGQVHGGRLAVIAIAGGAVLVVMVIVILIVVAATRTSTR